MVFVEKVVSGPFVVEMVINRPVFDGFREDERCVGPGVLEGLLREVGEAGDIVLRRDIGDEGGKRCVSTEKWSMEGVGEEVGA